MDFYKKMSVGDLQKLVTPINWTTYFSLVFKEIIPLDEPIVVAYASDYLKHLDALIRRFDTR